MKRSQIRMKRLFTALIIVILLNAVLMLLPNILRQKNSADSADSAGNLVPAEDLPLLVPSEGGAEDLTGHPYVASAAPNKENAQEPAEHSSDNPAGSDEKLPVSTKTPTDEKSGDAADQPPSPSPSAPLTLPPAANSETDGETPPPPSSFSEIRIFPAQPTPLPDDDTDDDTNTVTICLMGDLMCLAGQQYTAERSDGTHDYTGSFCLLRDTFASFDFVIGNLETTLSESNPYSTKAREVNEQPNCNAPADYLASLKWAGITHLVTANNHSLDGGLVGVEETIAHLDEYDIPHTGTYRPDYTGKRYLILEKNGIRIALISFTELINQRALVTKSQLSRIIDSYSRADAEDRIAQARADGADFVIVYEHWGSENVHDVRDYQKSHAKEIAEAGADLIIGSHPHCLQKMENIVTQDGRSVPCFYSLGNVVSSMTRDINHDTVFVQVCLKRDIAPEDTGETAPNTQRRTAITSLTLLPCHVLTAFDGHYRVITPTDYPTEDKAAAAELAAARERIETHYQRH